MPMRALPDCLRAFVALRMNAATEAAIASFVQELRAHGAGVAWAQRAHLHLTLRFLGGAVPSARIAPLDHALDQIAATTSSFLVRTRGTGAFPSLDRPRVLWIGLLGEPLKELAGRVEAATRECGFAPEPRPFAPHLTIGRVRHLQGWAPIRELLTQRVNHEFGESLVDSMILYQSELRPGGSAYEVVARYPLRPSA
jgi:2'-5' RNA ligase